MTSLNAVRFRNSLSQFINNTLKEHGLESRMGVVTSYTTDVDLIVKIEDVEGQIELSWKEGNLLTLIDHAFSINDVVVLMPVNNVMMVLGIIDAGLGLKNKANGVGFIANGTQALVITHGLNLTPTLGQITITRGEDPTNTVSYLWVDTITSTQMTIHSSADPGASNLDIGWSIQIF